MVRLVFALLTLMNGILETGAAEFRPVPIEDTKRECYGSYNRFSLLNNYRNHYESIRRIYGDCTYVRGNLEITHLEDPEIDYDLDFLSKIEVVTGYVLIAFVRRNITAIPLTSLKLIKGERPLMDRDGKPYGLMVLLAYADELQLPSLREISNGGVKLYNNPNMCHLNTIVWEELTSDDAPMSLDGRANKCECSQRCMDDTGHRHCWGNGGFMCQKVNRKRRRKCEITCPGRRCHSEGILGSMGCCHEQCAVGCFGGMDTQCLMCKGYKLDQQCVSQCPEDKFSYAGYCVPFH